MLEYLLKDLPGLDTHGKEPIMIAEYKPPEAPDKVTLLH